MENTPMQDQIMEEVEMNEPSQKSHLWMLGLFLLLLFMGSMILWKRSPNISSTPDKDTLENLETFSSSQEFISFIESGSESNSSGFFGMSRNLEMTMALSGDSVTSMGPGKAQLPEAAGAGRVSETNVQVIGVDEPDMVKSDGKNIFTSLSRPNYRIMEEPIPMMMEIDESTSSFMPPRDFPEPTTSVISAFPPKDMEKVSDIDKQGNLLLKDDLLIVIGSDEVVGFDVSDPSLPNEVWSIEIEDNTLITSARMIDKDLYLVTQTFVDYQQPCPISPLAPVGGLIIPCERIYHPVDPIQTDVTYSALKVNSDTGEVTDSVSLVGSSQSSVIYVSANAIYVTYTTFGDYSQFMHDFFTTAGSNLVSIQVKDKLNKLASYDISSQAKMIEIQNILQDYYRGMSNDERRRIENEVENKMGEFATSKMREMEKTGIVKISLDDLSIQANGNVPGHPLNQFSLDEFDGNLRIATSVGGRSLSGSESANDVYILDKNLKSMGSITDMGLDERIYSVRFVGEMGYVVTFKETDPFYVLDLSSPKDPTLEGELKIPGYSSYLHPISDEIILGIGKEDSNVKLSMFDVSDPKTPIEVDKYSLDAYWSDVSNTHHAFLQDEKHKIFFIPAGQDGYIFSYDDNLSLEKVVSGVNAKRAIFLDDFLYVIGEGEIVVLDEEDWEVVGNLEY